MSATDRESVLMGYVVRLGAAMASGSDEECVRVTDEIQAEEERRDELLKQGRAIELEITKVTAELVATEVDMGPVIERLLELKAERKALRADGD